MADLIQAIIFDFGNVQYRFHNDRFLAGLAALCGRPAAELQRAIYEASTLNQDYETGRIDSAAFLAGVGALCGQELPEAAFIKAYTDIFTPIESTLELIQELKANYRIGLLSNTSPWHFEHAIRRAPVFPLYDTVTLSYDVRASKPQPEIYEDALRKLALPPEACVYIDDLAPFAQAATRQGLHGITYTTPAALLAELRLLKVAC